VNRGVFIDYYLRQPPAKVTIELKDEGGRTVRSFSGTPDSPKKPDEAPPAEEELFRRPEPKVTAKAGVNRFVWDMRYPGPTTFPKMILWAAGTWGPAAPPGRYQVTLSVVPAGGGEGTAVSQTAVFAIRPHPWLTGVTNADFQEQFRFALQIRDRVSQADEAVIRIRALKDQIQEHAAKGKNAKLAAAAEKITTALTAVEGEIYQYRNQSSQDPLNYPIKLNNKLAALLEVVESADGRPTDQSYETFKDLSSRLETQLDRLAGIEKTELTAFNKEAAGLKLPAVR
jgi:hypothetical protein